MNVVITPTDFSGVSLNAVNYAADMAAALHMCLLVCMPRNPVFLPVMIAVMMLKKNL
jgi:hypothetical protein